MDTLNSIVIKASPSRIFEAAAQVEAWPTLLSHYRQVRFAAREGDVRLVHMAAHRDGFPCRWFSLQILFPAEKKIYYRHIRSFWTRGMEVWWSITPLDKQNRRVTITHSMPDLPRFPFAGWFYRVVIGRIFVHTIAERTLKGLKRHLETGVV
ncbi:MAG: SRPBCC family protein [candidate division FCPU426 bacterium]